MSVQLTFHFTNLTFVFRFCQDLIDNEIRVTAVTISMGCLWHTTVNKTIDCRRKLQNGAIGFLEIVIDFSTELRLLRPIGHWIVMRLQFFKKFPVNVKCLRREAFITSHRSKERCSISYRSFRSIFSTIFSAIVHRFSQMIKFSQSPINRINNELHLEKKQKSFNMGKHELPYWMNCKPVHEMNEAFAFVCYSKMEYLSLGRRYSVVVPLNIICIQETSWNRYRFT